MTLSLLKSKIHEARVTDRSLDYEGSLTIDSDLMDRIGLLPFERILIGNMANGERFETYAIPGKSGSRAICLNGATARLGERGDRLTIMSFGLFTPEEAAAHKPSIITLDKDNNVLR